MRIFQLCFLVSQNGLERISYGKKREEDNDGQTSDGDTKSTTNINSRKSSNIGYNLPIVFSVR